MKTLFYLSAFTFTILVSPVHSQWVQQNLQGDINIIIGIDFINQNKGVTGGWFGDLSQQIYGSAFSTSDRGNNWIPAITPDSMRVFVGLHMINDMIVYGAGAYNLSTQPDSHKLNHFRNLKPYQQKFLRQIGIDISGQENYRGYFVESTDGGLTWHPKGTLDDSISYLVDMTFIDNQTGFVLGTSQGVSGHCILKTTNGGNNWYYVFPFQYGMWIQDIEFFDNQNGIAVGEETSPNSAGVILTTTDGGETWIKSYSGNMSSIFSLAYMDLNTILIAGLNTALVTGIFKSTDGGASWQPFHTYSDLHFIDGVDVFGNTGIILAYGGYYPSNIYTPIVDISLDNGFTWSYSVFDQFREYILVDSKMVSESNWYLCGGWVTSNGFVLFTDNWGGVPVELVSFTAESIEKGILLDWTTATELNNLGFEIERKVENEEWRIIGFVEGGGTTTEIQNYSFPDDLFGVTISKLFYRLKQIDFDGTFEYSDEVEVIRTPEEFSLEQNYPNPFNPTTKIKFTVPNVIVSGAKQSPFVTLKIYNILGNEIATLVNEEKPAGEYEVEFTVGQDSSPDIASGIYFYKLVAGEYNQTKKMVLLK